ncbi:MAG: histidine phosphatase family protein [Gammaproteobacteria bacterium]|nr:histidine phosphatase family protein [Gammaproteobacteria bacterium]
MRTKETSTQVYFIRHGQTDFPNDRIYCDDREDPSLIRQGLIQAKSAALYFQDVPIDALYCSPALRTRMTAAEVSQVTGVAPVFDERLRERRFGIWEGLYFDEIERLYPQEYAAWKADPVNFTPEGGETMHDVNVRLQSGLDHIMAAHQGRAVAIVCHVGPIRMAVTRAFHIPEDQYRQIRVDYAGITRIDYGRTINNLIFLNNVRYKG